MNYIEPIKSIWRLNGVYLLRIANHTYVGSCANKLGFIHRWRGHLYKLIANNHASPKLQNTFNKYNELRFELLEICSPNKCIEREQHYINILKPDLNIRVIAKSNLGLKTRESTKEKLSKANKGRTKSESTRRKLSEANKGRDLSHLKTPEILEKLSIAHRGKSYHVLSLEARNRIRQANIGKKLSEETKNKKRLAMMNYWKNKKSLSYE